MLRVLFIDDDAPEIEPVAFELKAMNIHVDVLESVADAEHRLFTQRTDYDLVVVDIVMPTEGLYSRDETESGTQTGARLIEKIRTRRPELNVASLTIRGDSFIAELLDGVGVTAQFRKPYFRAPLAQQIVRLLAQL